MIVADAAVEISLGFFSRFFANVTVPSVWLEEEWWDIPAAYPLLPVVEGLLDELPVALMAVGMFIVARRPRQVFQERLVDGAEAPVPLAGGVLEYFPDDRNAVALRAVIQHRFRHKPAIVDGDEVGDLRAARRSITRLE
jgi:hypothetical protein